MSRPFLWALSQLHFPVFATLHHHPHMHIPVTNTCTQYTALLTDGDSKASEAQGLKSDDERRDTPFRTLLELQVEPTRAPEDGGGERSARHRRPCKLSVWDLHPFHPIRKNGMRGGSLPTVTARHSLASLTLAFTHPCSITLLCSLPTPGTLLNSKGPSQPMQL